MSQIIIHYRRFNDSQEWRVRVKLSAGSGVLEWDIFFSRPSSDVEADVTINWRSLDINSNGVFYTDANAYKMVKRVIPNKTETANKTEPPSARVPSYFYPVSSAIFVEEGASQMVVMNDRPQGGSAHVNGRVELMLVRQGSTQDEIGIWESMRDWSEDGKGVNISAKFHLAFTNNRTELFTLI